MPSNLLIKSARYNEVLLACAAIRAGARPKDRDVYDESAETVAYFRNFYELE